MALQLVRSEESNPTVSTLVKLEVEMSSFMVLLIAFSGELLTTKPAQELFLTGMELNVVNQT